MLKEDFYSIIDIHEDDDRGSHAEDRIRSFKFTVKLIPDHVIYEGHFPGNPVVPGVCQVQIIKELTSHVLQKDLVISRSDNIKFLSVIIPSSFPFLDVSIDIRDKDAYSWFINCVIQKDEKIFLKFKGEMRTFSDGR